MSVAAPPVERRLAARGSVPRLSPFLVWGFDRYLTRGFGLRGGYVTRHFHAVRLARTSERAFPADRPLVFFLNHPGWWDPIMAYLLARCVVPGRHPYAPIEQEALDRYPLLDRIGLFGVDGSPRGVRSFLDTSQAILARPDASLWLTPQGRFADPDERPVTFEPGLGHLARRVEALFVPVAIDYRFRGERLPEAFARIGAPADSAGEADRSAGWWTARLEAALEETLDALAVDLADRSGKQFDPVVVGGSGVGPLYDLVRRLRAIATGRCFTAEHLESRGRGPT
jgi:1-acyl-sn-glycerol-3-phosphate acyltransferase